MNFWDRHLREYIFFFINSFGFCDWVRNIESAIIQCRTLQKSGNLILRHFRMIFNHTRTISICWEWLKGGDELTCCCNGAFFSSFISWFGRDLAMFWDIEGRVQKNIIHSFYLSPTSRGIMTNTLLVLWPLKFLIKVGGIPAWRIFVIEVLMQCGWQIYH